MNLPQRKPLRLQHYDYAKNGAYFITICTHHHAHLFGEIVGNGLDRSELRPTTAALIAEAELNQIPQHFASIQIDHYVFMPNHVHLILLINQDLFAERSRPFPTVSTVIGLYKSGVSKKIGFPIWQKSFYDHVIRNQSEYEKIWGYIDGNPLRWKEDRYFNA